MTTDLTATARKLATAPGATIGSVLTGLAAEDSKATDVVLPKPKAPALDPSTREALRNLPALLESVSFPTEARELSPDEEKTLVALGEAVNDVKGFVEKLNTNAVRTTLFNHLDRVAERNRSVGPETPRDGKGHYLTKGEGNGYVREYSSGTPGADVAELERLVQEGLLTKREFLSATRQVRVIDENGLLTLIGRKPEKLGAIRRAIKFTRSASCSLKFK